MRDLNTGIVTPAPVIVDEQAKAAAMRAAAAAAPAAAVQIAKTPDELLLDKVTAQIDKIKNAIKTLDPNTPVPGETAAERLARIKNTRETGGGTEPPSEAPAGTHWSFIGGQWKLYKDAVSSDAAGGDTIVSSVDNGDGTTTTTWKSGRKETNVTYNKGTSPATGAIVTPTPVASATSPVASLAIDTFKGTLALFFGQGEMSQPWVTELYNLVNPLYKTGSTIDEAFNLALQQGRKNPNLKAFTDRFQGIYDLQDKLVAGQAVLVPTIAQYTAAEAGMGNVLRQAGLGSIATQQYLGTVIGKGLSVTDVGNYINNIYSEIQNLPQDIKDSVMLHYPGLDNVSLAKAILTGDKGFTQLQKELTAQEIQGVAAKQGLGTYNPVTGKYGGISDAQSMDLAGQGFNMASAQSGLTKAAIAAPTVDLLSNITAGATPMTQADIVNATVGGLASQQRKLDLLAQQEVNRFQGGSGNAPGAFSTGYLRRTSAAGLI
jgi:hypothetical protein